MTGTSIIIISQDHKGRLKIGTANPWQEVNVNPRRGEIRCSGKGQHLLPHMWHDYCHYTSTKQMTRRSRAGNDPSGKHHIDLHTTLPAYKVVLNVVYNKVQLINSICQYLMNHIVDNQTKLVITEKDPLPVHATIPLSRDQIWKHTMKKPHQVQVVTHTSKWPAMIRMYLSCLFISTSKKRGLWMSAWRVHVLGEQS